MKSFILLISLILLPIVSLAGGEDGSPGIINPITLDPLMMSPMSHAKFIDSDGAKVRFLLKSEQSGETQAFEQEENTLEESSPLLMDALEESFMTNDDWIEL